MAAHLLSRSSPSDRVIDLQAQVERLTRCELLSGSPALCSLLRYLAARTSQGFAEPTTEHVLASEVFGRGTHFDPQVDSTVRVQVGRLRSKLNQYYAGPGAGDPLVLTVPRGAYLLSVEKRFVIVAVPVRTGARPARSFFSGRKWWVAGLFVIFGILLGAAIVAVAKLPIFR